MWGMPPESRRNMEASPRYRREYNAERVKIIRESSRAFP
jgi:hypothetical protein